MSTKVLARFYSVSKPEAGEDFHDILAFADGLGTLKKREKLIHGTVTVRLERYACDGDFIKGEFCRKQTENIPPSAGPDGLNVIELPEGGGLGHIAAFVYHIPTRIILLEVNKMSVTAPRLPLYIKSLKPGRIFVLSPIFRNDAWDRLGEKKVRRLRVKFAKPENLAEIEGNKDTAQQSAKKLAAAFNATTVDITVSVGQDKKKFLSRKTVIDTVKAVLGADDDVAHLDVTVIDDHGSDPIDFIEESLKVQKDIDLHGCNLEQAFERRMAFLKGGFDDNINYVKKIFEGR